MKSLLIAVAWTPIFFGAHLAAPALAAILSLLAATLLFIKLGKDAVARWCFAFDAVWLCYASALNSAVLALN